MPLPSWKDLKKAAKVDPARAEELRRGAQRGVEQGRAGLAKRLAGPASHLRNVGSEFKAGLTQPEPGSAPASAPDATGSDPAGTPDAAASPPPTDPA